MSGLANNLTALQLHVAFWDYNNDSIITPVEIYRGFRDLGFCIPYSLGGLLIPIFFSYPTTLGHSWLPDPLFRIYTDTIHKAKHGSDTGVYSSDGNLRLMLFDEVFEKMDSSSLQDTTTGDNTTNLEVERREPSLGVGDLFRLHAKNRAAADPAGWSFAAMEWWTTWLLLQRDGRLWKEDLRAIYDGTLFWKIREERAKKGKLGHGYGWQEWWGGLWNNGTWKTWEIRDNERVNVEAEREL
ncbi:MAG: hypothetical protein Q9226_003090 [Calogaya cf. arnoldii]